MAKRIFITATNTDIGKTHTALALIRAFSRMGLRVGVFKPIETGVCGFPVDGQALFETALSLNPSLSALSLDDIVPLRFPLPAAPYVASGGEPIDFDRIERSLARIEALCDIVLIEGAGGLYVPIDETTMMIDLPGRFDAFTLLITHCRLGCINDTLLNLKALTDAKLPYLWGLNCREGDEAFARTSLPYFAHHFDRLYFLPDDIDALARVLLDTIP